MRVRKKIRERERESEEFEKSHVSECEKLKEKAFIYWPKDVSKKEIIQWKILLSNRLGPYSNRLNDLNN